MLFGQTAEGITGADIEDPNWVNDVLVVLSAWDILDRDVASIDPPEIFQDSHDLIQECFEYIATAGEYIKDAIGPRGTERDFERATEYILDGNNLMQDALDALPVDLPRRERLDR
jgi:hypothetical protein